MLRNKNCSNCINCQKDVQIDMGCTMDVCKAAEHFLGIYSGVMCQEWKAEHLHETIITDDCPCYVPKTNGINPELKNDFIKYIDNQKSTHIKDVTKPSAGEGNVTLTSQKNDNTIFIKDFNEFCERFLNKNKGEKTNANSNN